MPASTQAPVLTAFVSCTTCGREIPRKSYRCVGCGSLNRPPAAQAGKTATCFQCGTSLSGKSNICPSCGFAH